MNDTIFVECRSQSIIDSSRETSFRSYIIDILFSSFTNEAKSAKQPLQNSSSYNILSL